MSDSITDLINGLSQTEDQRNLNKLLESIQLQDKTVSQDSTEALLEAGLIPNISSLLASAPQNVRTTPAARQNLVPPPRATAEQLTTTTVPPQLSPNQVARPIAAPQGVSREELRNALRMTESGGDDSAVSPKGAVGPYQFLPATAKWIAEKANIPWRGTEALKNEGYSRKLADAYLDYLGEKFGANNIPMVLAGYNWGPSNLEKLVERAGSTNYRQLFTKLPEETRKHYNRTMSHILRNRSAQTE